MRYTVGQKLVKIGGKAMFHLMQQKQGKNALHCGSEAGQNRRQSDVPLDVTDTRGKCAALWVRSWSKQAAKRCSD